MNFYYLFFSSLSLSHSLSRPITVFISSMLKDVINHARLFIINSDVFFNLYNTNRTKKSMHLSCPFISLLIYTLIFFFDYKCEKNTHIPMRENEDHEHILSFCRRATYVVFFFFFSLSLSLPIKTQLGIFMTNNSIILFYRYVFFLIYDTKYKQKKNKTNFFLRRFFCIKQSVTTPSIVASNEYMLILFTRRVVRIVRRSVFLD